MEPTSFVFIPFWVEKVLKRNKLSLKDILEYEKIRKYFSLEDLAGLLCVQESDQLGSFSSFKEFSLRTVLLSSWMKTSGALAVELGSAVIPLSYSKEVKNYVLVKLSEQDVVSQNIDDPVYRIVDIERNTFCIVLKPGFVKLHNSVEALLDFVKDILKVFYVYHKVEVVSREPIFKAYLNLLEGSTPKA